MLWKSYGISVEKKHTHNDIVAFKCSFQAYFLSSFIFPVEKACYIVYIVTCNVVDIYAGGKCLRRSESKEIFRNNSNESMLCMKRTWILKYVRSSLLYYFLFCFFGFFVLVPSLSFVCLFYGNCFAWIAVFQVAFHFLFIWFDFGKVIVCIVNRAFIDGIIFIILQYEFSSPLQLCRSRLAGGIALNDQKKNQTIQNCIEPK